MKYETPEEWSHVQFFNDENETKAHRATRLQGYLDNGNKAAEEAAHNNDIAQHMVTNVAQPAFA